MICVELRTEPLASEDYEMFSDLPTTVLDNAIYVANIQVSDLGRCLGLGTLVMRELCEEASNESRYILLFVNPYDCQDPSRDDVWQADCGRLSRWYRRLGFSGSYSMYKAPTTNMNYRTKQLIDRTVKRYTAFTSFLDLILASASHGYIPTIRPWGGAPIRTAMAIRALAQQYDLHFESLGSSRRCFRGSDA